MIVATREIWSPYARPDIGLGWVGERGRRVWMLDRFSLQITSIFKGHAVSDAAASGRCMIYWNGE